MAHDDRNTIALNDAKNMTKIVVMPLVISNVMATPPQTSKRGAPERRATLLHKEPLQAGVEDKTFMAQIPGDDAP